jgi:hypothetical protein
MVLEKCRSMITQLGTYKPIYCEFRFDLLYHASSDQTWIKIIH